MKQKDGFILVTTLMVTTLFVFLATYISYRSLIFSSFSQTTIERQKAYSLALGGVQVGIAMIANAHKLEEETEHAKALLTNLLPGLNRWQTFALNEEIDGVDGTINLSISSEEGKINLNEIYDFQTHTFLGEGQAEKNWETILKVMFARIDETMKTENTFDALEQFLKTQDKPLDDLTQLITLKEFAPFKDTLFYHPPEPNTSEKRPLYLSDIFTLWSGTSSLQPWLLSDSISALLNLPRVQSGEIDKRRTSVRKWLQDFTVKNNWSDDWDVRMVPIYGKDYTSLPKSVGAILAGEFEPHVFSILSQGTVGQVKQRLLALVERVTLKAQNETQFEVKIRKLYWL